MKKNINSLNEEILRIKSLFSEERMYGNILEQETEGETTGEEEGNDDDFLNRKSRKQYRKDVKTQEKTKKIKDTKQDVNKDDRQYLQACRKGINNLTKSFFVNDKNKRLRIVPDNQLDKSFEKAVTIDGIEFSYDEGFGYHNLITECRDVFGDDKLNVGNFAKRSATQLLDMLLNIVDPEETDLDKRNQHLSLESGVGSYLSDKTGVDKISTLVNKLETVDIKNKKGFAVGKLSWMGSNKFNIDPVGKYTIVDTSEASGNRDFGKFKIYDDYRDSIDAGVKSLYDMASKKDYKEETIGPKTVKGKEISFIDANKFLVIGD